MNVGLLDGIVYLVLDMGDEQKIERIGQGRQFDDNYWHEVIIEREAKEVSVWQVLVYEDEDIIHAWCITFHLFLGVRASAVPF